MTYLRTHNKRFSRSTSIAIIFAISIVIIITLIQFIAPKAFLVLFNSIAKPFWRMEFAIDVGALSSFERLLADNEDLKRQLLDMDVRIATVKDIEKENEELKSLLGRASTTSKVLAAVLKRPPYSAYDIIVIDIGKEYNISTTSKVYAIGNIPIGYISNVSGQISKVMLFSSPGQKHEVLIGPNNLPATAIGRGGGQYEAQLPQGSKIVEGDFVTIPSLDNKPLGAITTIRSNPTELFETILFAPPVNIYGLRWVLVDVTNKY